MTPRGDEARADGVLACVGLGSIAIFVEPWLAGAKREWHMVDEATLLVSQAMFERIKAAAPRAKR